MAKEVNRKKSIEGSKGPKCFCDDELFDYGPREVLRAEALFALFPSCHLCCEAFRMTSTCRRKERIGLCFCFFFPSVESTQIYKS